MKTVVTRLIRLIFGLFLYALGMATTLMAQIGYAPWDVFHAGLAGTAGISIGTATIAAGIVVIVLAWALKEKIGLGSLLNMVLVGLFLDLILWLRLVPAAGSYGLGVLMLILGLMIIALGSYFYISSGFGAGPRDSLMVALARKTKLPVGVCRGGVELTALILGWRLGGMVGVGTILSALLIGFCLQLVFRLFRFDATAISHQTIAEVYTDLFPAVGLEEKE